MLLLAAAKPPGFLSRLVTALMQLIDPTISGLSPPNPEVVARLLLTLLFLRLTRQKPARVLDGTPITVQQS